MDFSLDDEQTAMRDAVRGLLKTYDTDHRREVVGQDPGYDEKMWSRLAEMGVLGLPFPEEHGGMGAGPVEVAIVAQELGGARHVEQGLVVTTLTGVGALSSFVARNRTSRQITIYGTTALALGTALTLVALAFGSYWGFIAAAVVAGSGFGTAFLGIMRSITPTVGPDERGELFASVFVVSYLAFGLPAVAAGFAAQDKLVQGLSLGAVK